MITLCMIVKNESATLEKCLESAVEKVDEIVIVDTGSTDNTKEIAARYGRVYDFEWCDDFSAARNHALKYALGDWALIMDADEVLCCDTDAIREIVGVESKAVLPVIQIKIHNTDVQGEIKAATSHFTVRLFPLKRGLKYFGRIHEQVLHPEKNMTKIVSITEENAFIIHSGYQGHVVASKNKFSRNMKLLEKSIQEQPNCSFHYFNKGITLKSAGLLDDAEAMFEKTAEMHQGQENWPHYLSANYAYWLSVMCEKNRYGDAYDLMYKAKPYCIENPDFWVLSGTVFQHFSQLEKAFSCYKNAIRLKDHPSIQMMDAGSISWKPLLNMAEIYTMRGLPALASEFVMKASEFMGNKQIEALM